jgi:hypothetical protein
MKSRSTKFPNLDPRTATGLMTWIVLIAMWLPIIRALVILGWTAGDIVIAVALGLLGFYAIVGILTPISLKRRQWIATDRLFSPISLDGINAPEVFRSWAATLIPVVEGLGFTFRGAFRPSQVMPDSEMFLALFENRKLNQIAQLFTVTAKRGIIRRSETVLVFSTDFADHTRLYTSNSRVLALEPRIRIREGSMRFPEIDDPRRLYEIHQATLAWYAAGAPRLAVAIDDPAEYLRAAFQNDIAKFTECGYYFVDTKRNVLRLTWRGAFLVTWKSLWPFKWIRQFRSRGQATRLLY